MKKPIRYVWLDLEMTGLNPANDTVLEFAMIITDAELNQLSPDFHYVISQPLSTLEAMGEWCLEHHQKSGLWDKVLDSAFSLETVQEKACAFLKEHCENSQGILAGNSIWQDRRFLHKYFPDFETLLHYRMVDVSSFKVVFSNWSNSWKDYKKKETHRALDDIRESLEELKHYRSLTQFSTGEPNSSLR